MISQSRFARYVALAFSLSVSGVLASPGYALDTVLETLTLDQGEKGSTRFTKIEITGANLTQDELRKIFALPATDPERKALLARLRADKIAIPDMVVTDKTSTVTLSNLVAAGISEGKVARASLEGIKGNFSPEQGGKGTLSSGAISFEGADFSSLLGLSTGNLAFSKLALEALAFTFPDRDTPETAVGGNIMTLKLGSLVAETAFEGSIPIRAAMRMKGLTLQAPPASALSRQLAIAGYDTLDLGLSYLSTYDIATRVLSLEDLTLTGAGAGSLQLKTRFGGMDKSIFTGTQEEKIAVALQGYIGTLILHYADAGLVNKTIGLLAQSQQKTPEALRREAAATIRQLVPFLLGGMPKAPKIAETLAGFVEKPGTLGIVLQPKGGLVAMLDLAQMTDPMAFLARIELDVEAGGIAATLPAMPPVPAAKPAAKAQAAPNAPIPAAPPKRAGLDAWNALVGNSIIGKDSEGSALVEYYQKDGTVKQRIDDEIATGTWSFKTGEVCFEFPDDEEETCYKVTLDGSIATFTGDDGVDRRYEVLEGNPKKL